MLEVDRYTIIEISIKKNKTSWIVRHNNTAIDLDVLICPNQKASVAETKKVWLFHFSISIPEIVG